MKVKLIADDRLITNRSIDLKQVSTSKYAKSEAILILEGDCSLQFVDNQKKVKEILIYSMEDNLIGWAYDCMVFEELDKVISIVVFEEINLAT